MERNPKLEAARRLRGWTLELASQKIGVHPQTLRRWEMGKSKPHGFRIFKISEVYEATPTALGIGYDYQLFPPSEESALTGLDSFLPTFAESFIAIEDLDLRLMSLILQRKLDRQNLDYAPFQQQIHQCIREYDECMGPQSIPNPESSTRLRALSIVASIPLVAYLENIHQRSWSVPPEDILTHCAGAITACWHMEQKEDFATACSFVSGYVILLGEIFARYTHCRLATAELIAQAYLLRTMLSLQFEAPQISLGYYTKALEFSQTAANIVPPDLSSLRQCTPHHYGKQPARTLERMAEAVWLLKPAPVPPDFSLIRNYLQEIASLYQMPLLVEREPALLSRSEQNPSARQPEIVHFPSSIDYAETALNLWDGITYHELSEYARKLDKSQPVHQSEAVYDAPEQIRLEFLQNRALAALRLHDMNQAITTLRAVIPQALSLGNEQQLVEAREAYHLIQFLRPGDSPLPTLKLKDLLKKHD